MDFVELVSAMSAYKTFCIQSLVISFLDMCKLAKVSKYTILVFFSESSQKIKL
jgi:hypothetical protein